MVPNAVLFLWCPMAFEETLFFLNMEPLPQTLKFPWVYKFLLLATHYVFNLRYHTKAAELLMFIQEKFAKLPTVVFDLKHKGKKPKDKSPVVSSHIIEIVHCYESLKKNAFQLIMILTNFYSGIPLLWLHLQFLYALIYLMVANHFSLFTSHL